MWKLSQQDSGFTPPPVAVALKLVSLLSVIGLLAVGILTGREVITILGAILFISSELVSLVQFVGESKLYRQGLWEPREERGIFAKLTRWLQGLMFFIGLAGIFIVPVAGAIIYVGVIVSYFVHGVVAQHIAGIPLRMGYGGWYISRRRGRRNQSRRNYGGRR